MYGEMGGPVLGVMLPGHEFGKLSSMASKGSSGVYLNGRQLQLQEAKRLAQIFGYPHPFRAVTGCWPMEIWV